MMISEVNKNLMNNINGKILEKYIFSVSSMVIVPQPDLD